jgi:hypothetical protein
VSGDQHGRRHAERQAPEFLLSDDVGERLAADPPLDERLIPAGEIGRLGLASGCDESLGRPAKNELGEQARVELGAPGGKARVAEPAARIGDVLMDGVRRQRWRLSAFRIGNAC